MPLTEEIYRSFTEFKRKTRQAVLNALEDELHVHKKIHFCISFGLFYFSKIVSHCN